MMVPDLQAITQTAQHALSQIDPWEAVKGLGGGSALGLLIKLNVGQARLETKFDAHLEDDKERFAAITSEMKEKFSGTERRFDGLSNVVSAIDAKLGAWYDGLVGRVQDILSHHEERIEHIVERVDRLVDGRE